MKKLLLFLFALVTMATHAQSPGDVAQTYGANTGFNGTVFTLVVQPDGKILVGGSFSIYKGDQENKIIRLNTDGSKDTTFTTGTGFSGSVHSIVLQTDGKILVGGNFTTYNGVTENNIIRLNSDGSKDTTFNTGTGFNSIVYSIALQADGKILIGGNFTTYKGVTENGIIRLNTNGSKNTTFSTGTGFSNSNVYTIKLQSDGKILVGGSFNAYNGSTENNIVRLNSDGSNDTTFNTGTGFDKTVWTINLQSDGKILVGGSFNTYKGITENNIIRLNTNGNKDTTFNTGTGFNNVVLIITIQTDGKILLGGIFTSYNGTTTGSNSIRLNSNGTKDATFNTGTGFNGVVNAIVPQSNGKILVGGGFSFYIDSVEKRIVSLNNNGSKDATFDSEAGFNDIIYIFKLQEDGKILVGGNFTNYKGTFGSRINRLNPDGSKDVTFTTIGIGFNSTVFTLAQQTDGKILIGGNFSTYNGGVENRIIRLNEDGTKDVTFNTGTGFNGRVDRVVLQTDGKILIGGAFSNYNGSTANRIIRLNTDGTKDVTFNTGTGFNNSIYEIKIQDDGKILVGGIFTNYNGSTENRIIRLNTDGTKDVSFNIGTGFDSLVQTIALQTDGKILVGGSFTNYNGVTNNGIIRLDSNGSKDTTFNSGTGFNFNIRSIIQLTNGKIIVGGQFNTYNGVTENKIISLNTDGTKNTTFNAGTGFDADASHINELADGKILIGGAFTTYKGDNSSAYLIKLHTKYTTIWDGTAWSNGVPDTTKDAIIDGDYNLNIGISADNLTVNTNKVLTIKPGIILTVVGKLVNNGSIVFKSDASGSGVFDSYTANIIEGTGTVTTERFIPAKRAFRFVSSAVTTISSILTNWQENTTTPSGFGTHITGGTTTLGFDQTATNNPSMFSWDNTTQNWVAIDNTIVNTLTAGTPYRLMVRGDRTIDLSTNTPTPTNTVLKASGKLHVGNYSPSLNSAVDGFSFIGNPYQSVVNMKQVLTASTNMKNDALYYWDPTLNTRGAYVTRDLITNTNSITSAFNEYLQPGQAVFVQKDNTVNVPTLTITENNKATSQAAPGVFKLNNTQVSNTSYLKIELTSPNVSAVLDGSLLQFDAAYSWNVSPNDFIKLGNLDEQLGFKLENKLLAIAKKSVPLNQDEVPLEITNYRQTNYQFNFDLVNYNGPTPYLFDTLDASYTEINDTTSKSFTVDTQNTLTTNPNRFKIVFNNTALSAAEFDFAAIKLYPNPIKASQKQAFTLSNIEEKTTVNLFNSLGQEILVKTTYESGNVIVSATTVLSNGFYTVVVKTPSGNAKSFKLIVE